MALAGAGFVLYGVFVQSGQNLGFIAIWGDLILLLFSFPLLEAALQGRVEGRFMVGVGLLLRVVVTGFFYWLDNGLGTPEYILWGLSYLLMGWRAYAEIRNVAGGLVAIFISAVSMMVIFVVCIELHQENHPDFLLAVVALSSLMFAIFMGLVVNLYGFQAQAEERLRRWINLLERLNLLGPQPTQTLVPAGILGELLEVLRTLFPDAVGLETRLAGNQQGLGEGIRVGYPTEHVKVFPMESETEAQLYFSGPAHDERSLEVLSPLLAKKLRQAQALLELQHKAHTDPLTGLLNRRELERQTPRLLAQARRESRPVTLALLDLDHFKRVNDTYGHARGDQVLQTLANLLRSHLRSEDLAVRWGGEEFALLLCGTKTEEAHAVLERIRSELRNLDGLLEWPPTLSAGLAGGRVPASEVEFEGWIGQADQALMRAKEDGRDRVNLAGLFGES